MISAIISIVVLVMFFTGGVVDPAAEMKEPIHTELLLQWTYVLFFATIACTVLMALWQFAGSLKHDFKSAMGTLVVLILFVAMLGVTYTIADATPLTGLNADSQVYNTATWLKVTDMWIYSTYILIALILLVAVLGSIKKILNK